MDDLSEGSFLLIKDYVETLKPHGVETNLQKSNSLPRQNCLILTKASLAENFPTSPALVMED